MTPKESDRPDQEATAGPTGDGQPRPVSAVERGPTAPLPDAPTPPTQDATNPWLPAHDEAPPPGPEGGLLGNYEVLGEIARGGMGIVYKARHRKLNRVVALKVTRTGESASEAESQRFHAEAEAAARLDHPYIVPIYEVGELEGRRFLAMALVEGQSLAQRVAAGPLPPRAAAALLLRVAQAVAYAHDQGIIHRDLKPANVLLDAKGHPRVTDFGLAKRTDVDSGLTQAGQVMGTPSYMSPEQAEARNDKVGPLADVYSLGATLYCLLTGRPPFQSADLVDTLRQVVEREPVPPRALNHIVDHDLNTIVLKCLRKKPENRYVSAAALVEDLGRFVEGRPILARPVGQLDKLVRWGRRNPLAAASLAGVAAVFVTAFALVSWSYVRAEDAREDEATQRRAADDARDTARREQKAERWGRYRANITAASGALQLQNSGAAGMALNDAPEEHRSWEWDHLHSQLDGAALKIPVPGGAVASVVLSPSGRQVAVCCSDHPEVYLYDVATGREVAVLRGHSAVTTSVAYRPDGGQVATASNDQTIRLWDPATGRQTALLQADVAAPHLDRNPQVAYSADGTRLASSSPADRGACTSRLWDATTGRPITTLAKWQQGTVPLAFSPDGLRVAVGSGEFIHLCDAATGRLIRAIGAHGQPVTRLAYSSDGKRLACTTGNAKAIHLWDGETGDKVDVLQGHTSWVGRLQFSPDGSRLLSATTYPDRTARLWDAATGGLVEGLTGHKNSVDASAFSPDGRTLATGSLDQTVRLWDGRTGRLLAVMSGHTGKVMFVVFSPDGRRVITAAEDATLRLWQADTGELIGVLRGHGDTFPMDCPPIFTQDGSRLVSGCRDGTVRVWDMSLLERNGILQGHESFVYDVAFSPDGGQVASAAWDGTARLWDATTGQQTALLKHETGIILSVAYRRDGRRLVTGEGLRGVALWDVASPNARRDSWFDHAGLGEGCRASPNPAGTLLAAGSKDGPVHLWEVASRREAARLVGHDKGSTDVAFHPDGGLIAGAGRDGTVRLWDVATRAEVAVLRGHTELVHRVAFSADGKLLASCSGDNTVRLWDVRTHEQLAEIGVGSAAFCVAFSPDGTRLAAGCRDNTVRLIDVAHREQVAELRGHSDYVHAVAWNPDGTRLVSGSGDFTVRVWDSLSAQERKRREKR